MTGAGVPPRADLATTASAGGPPGAVQSDENGAPITPRGVVHRGGAVNPTVADLSATFGNAIVRHEVVWGETSVVVRRDVLHDVIRWLHDTPTQRYDYLVDVTAVEFREAMRPLEVVWHLRALGFRRFLRVKVELARHAELSVPSIVDIYSGADWLERECFDMFGISFDGHPDLRRILMWDTYREGYPLRKNFPLRGRLRAEQLSQALAIDTRSGYSMNELHIAEAFDDLPEDMKRRLAAEAGAGDQTDDRAGEPT